MDEQRTWIKLRRKKRLLAAVLCFCLLFTAYPDILETLFVFAAGPQSGDGIVYVSGFAELPEEVREQTVPVGTGAEELELPDTLEAASVIEGVTWQSEPEYDGNTEGTYIFTAVLPEGYVLSEGVSLPQITVTTAKADEWGIMTLAAEAANAAGGEEIPPWGGSGIAPVRARGVIEEGILKGYISGMGNNLTFKAGEGEKTKVYYGNSSNPIDLKNLGEMSEKFSRTYDFPADGEGDVSNGFALKGYVLYPSHQGQYFGWQDSSAEDIGEGAWSDKDVVIRMEGGMLQAIDSTSGNRNPKSVTFYMSGGTICGSGGTHASTSVSVHAMHISGGTIQGSIPAFVPTDEVPGVYLSGNPKIGTGEKNGICVEKKDAKFRIEGAMTEGACVYINPFVYSSESSEIAQEKFPDGAVIAEGTGGYRITESDMSYFHLNGNFVEGRELYLDSSKNAICIRTLYPVTITANKDGQEWTDKPYTYKLKPVSGSGEITDLSAVPPGTYKIYEGSTDTGETVTVSSTAVTADGVVEAEVNYYTVAFYDGSTALATPAPQIVRKNSKAAKPADPAKTGYSFSKWVTADGGSAEFNFTAKAITEKTSVYASWTANAYKVTLHDNGGSGGTALTSYTYGTGAELPTDWTKKGYTLEGWYNNADFTGTAVKKISGTDFGDKVYWAKWKAEQYTVTFNYQEATGGSGTGTKTVTYDRDYGTLPAPERTGYTFKGWYTAEGGTGSKITSATTVGTAGNHTLYAYWKDETKPAAPVLQNNETLPEGWTCTQNKIPLKLYDGAGVTELWVSVDGAADYTQVSGFTGGTEYDYTVKEGEHTYRFKAKDAAGNESDASKTFKVMLDQKKPVIGELTYENKAANLWHWIIGKESLIICVPVTEQGSGVSKVSYTLTPADGSTGTTATEEIKNGKAKITVFADFKGTVAISCSDAAGNAADGVTVGASGGGIIVEDNAPEISVRADRRPTDMAAQTDKTALSESYYESAPAITVTVKDDADNAVAAGVASAAYFIGGVKYPVTVDRSDLQKQITFIIPADRIPSGVTQIGIETADNAGNTASETITVKVKGPEAKPSAKISYQTEKLAGLVPDALYSIESTDYQADAYGCIPIKEEWQGAEITIVKKSSSNETMDSEGQKLDIPQRPAAPAAPVMDSRTDGSVTLQTITNAQYRVADGGWQASTAFTGLKEKTAYSFTAYYPATDTAFASLPGSSTMIATMPKPPTEDKLAVSYAGETFVLKDGVEAFTEQACTNSVSAGDVTACMGRVLYIRYPADGIIPASLTTEVQISVRPEKPNAGGNDASYPNAQDGSITGLDAAFTYEIRKGTDGSFGAWEKAELSGTEIKNLPAGTYEVRVMAAENICFRSEAAAVTIGEKPATKHDTPTVQIDYANKTLTGFVPDAQYSVKYTDRNGTEQTMDIHISPDGIVPVEAGWFGTTFSIVCKGNGKDKTDSDPWSYSIPQKPAKPTPIGASETGWDRKDGKLTGLNADASYEISTDGGKTWESRIADGNGEITGLAPDSYVVRVKAGASDFASDQSEPVTIGEYRIQVTFTANGEIYKTFSVDYGKALTEIPPVPAKKDAGNRICFGEWCSDEQGTPAMFTNLTSDMTVYAVYTEAYTVTLVDGAGYTLSAVSGSTSPVKEGGSFSFRLDVDGGYQKTDSFAAKANGVKAERTGDGIYTITDIRENMTVTVEGIAKKSSLDGSGGSDGAPDNNTPADDNLNNPLTDNNLPVDNNTPQADNNPPADNNNLPGGTVSEEDTEPEEQQEPGSAQPPEQNTEKPSATEKEQLPGEKGVQTIPASTDNGRITASGETVVTGSITGTSETTTQLAVGNGAVIVTVVCKEETCTAGVRDTVAVANAVLSPKQIQLVNDGETIEIRVDVKDISKTVHGQDKEVIEGGLTEYQKEMKDLTLGTYVDISMFIKVGKGDWGAITTTEKPIEVVVGIPEELKEDGREFYIIRSHDGESALLTDMDDSPDTITISTDMFSAYAIAYEQAEGPASGESSAKCRLCHICPTFLGICCFIWLGLILAILLIIWIVIRRRKEENERVR